MQQLQLPISTTEQLEPGPTGQRLASLLRQDLDFHSKASNYASHNFHSFPAKFPPKLPPWVLQV